MSETRSLTFSRTVHATPAEALRAFTHPTLLRDWLCDRASSDPLLGGHLFLTWQQGYQVMGRYTLLDLPKTLAFTWLGAGDPGQTLVTVSAEAQGEETLITLVHSGLGREAGRVVRGTGSPDSLGAAGGALEQRLARGTGEPAVGSGDGHRPTPGAAPKVGDLDGRAHPKSGGALKAARFGRRAAGRHR